MTPIIIWTIANIILTVFSVWIWYKAVAEIKKCKEIQNDIDESIEQCEDMLRTVADSRAAWMRELGEIHD